MINLWNAWHGCHKISAGCQNCYMFRRDAKYGKDSTVVTKTANFRLPIKHKEIIHEPMLEAIDINKYLESGQIENVICGGESGENARPCNYDWVLNTREQCKKWEVPFYFKQTGANFIKDGKQYRIPRAIQMSQARKANIDLL